MQVRLCMKRGFQRLSGDKTYEFVRILATTVVSLVLGSIYYNLKPAASSMNDRCILLYFAVLFNALITCLEVRSLELRVRTVG
jgi:ATP-binding cassette, subfamily G (WHITE), member 2, PDR